MAKAIRLDDALTRVAQQHAQVSKRSIPKQIEYWAEIGRMAEENPDLPLGFVKELQVAQHELAAGDVEPFRFGD